MTTPVYRTVTPSLASPQTQSTASVLEFNCLYTHDIRRKSKRWQDGFVRFHTFNKRIMLYDIPRNLIGDTHWMGEGNLADGDEVTLDKSGVLIQIAEAIGTTETDLTGILSNRKNGSSKRGLSTSTFSSKLPNTGPNQVVGSTLPANLKRCSLNKYLGRSSASLGKSALRAKTPFELQYAEPENEECSQGRPLKRQRPDGLNRNDMIPVESARKLNHLEKDLPLGACSSDTIVRKKATAKSSVTRQMLSERGYSTTTPEIMNHDTTEERSHSRRLIAGGAAQILVPFSNRKNVSADHDATGSADIARSCKSKSGSMLRIISSASKKQLLCQDQLHLKLEDSPSTNADRAADRVNDAKIEREEMKPTGKSPRQLFKERLNRTQGKENLTQQAFTAVSSYRMTENIDASQRSITNCAMATVDIDYESQSRVSVHDSDKLDEIILKPAASEQHQLNGCDVSKTIEKLSDTVKVGERAVALNLSPEKQLVQGVNMEKCKIRVTAGVDFKIGIPFGKSCDAQMDNMITYRHPPYGQSAHRTSAEFNADTAQPVQPDNVQPSNQSFQWAVSKSKETMPIMTKSKRIHGASARYNLSPRRIELKQSKSALVHEMADTPNIRYQQGIDMKPRFNRTGTFNMEGSTTGSLMLTRRFQTPKPASPAVEKVAQASASASAADPWSREAFDLLDWRPPGWE